MSPQSPNPGGEEEAAQEIIKGHNSGRGFFIDWLVPRAFKVATAYLSSVRRGKEMEEALEYSRREIGKLLNGVYPHKVTLEDLFGKLTALSSPSLRSGEKD